MPTNVLVGASRRNVHCVVRFLSLLAANDLENTALTYIANGDYSVASLSLLILSLRIVAIYKRTKLIVAR